MKFDGMVFRIRAEIDGTKYEPGPIRASEAEKLSAWTGYELREWEARLVSGDPLAAKALIALERFRQGNHTAKISDVDITDVDSIDAEFVNDRGQVLTFKEDDDGNLIKVKGKAVALLDGEEPPGPLAPTSSPTGSG